MSSYDYWDVETGEGLSDDELYNRYDEMIDEVHGEPMGYPASRILKEVDPIAYNVGFNDWLSNEVYDNVITEIEPTEDEDAE